MGSEIARIEASDRDTSRPVKSRRRAPRLLFLAYGFPPRNTIGCVRAYNIAKWLTRRGWEVTVVTPYESAWGYADGAMDLHAELSRQGIRCIRTGHRWRSLLPLPRERRTQFATWIAGGLWRRAAASLGIEREAGWTRDAARACAGLTPDDVDLILASGPPFVSFGLAKDIANRLGRPYVLDYRDLWTANPHATRVVGQRMIDRERMVLAGSAAAIGVSTSLTHSLREQFGTQNILRVISNGFDPEELAQIPKQNFDHPAVVYTGTFYPPKRSVEPLMAALQRVEQSGQNQKPWAFHYYGYQGDYVRRVAEEHRVANRVVLHGNVPRREALAAVRGANLAVVISSIYEHASLQDKGIVTGKVFEAIGVGTPLLVIAPEGSDLDGVLSVTGLGKRFAGTQIDAIATFLQETLQGDVPPASNPDPFSWINIVDRLDGVLREAIRGNRN